jgi:hypothetical protein
LNGFSPAVLAIVICLGLQPLETAVAQDQNLDSSVLSSGGMSGQSLLHRHQGTLGQPHPVGRSSSLNAVLWSGFWRPQRGLSVSPVADAVPLVNRLWPNSPNPFNPMTTIKFSITDPVYLELAIFNVRGERIRTLVSEMRTPGVYSEVWDGRDDSGGHVASGVYLYRLINGDHHQTAKMLLVK